VNVFHVVHHWNGRDSLFSFILCCITGEPTWNIVINLLWQSCEESCYCFLLHHPLYLLHFICQYSWCAAYLQVLLRMVCHSPIAIPSLPLDSDHCSHSPASASHCPCSVMLASGRVVSLPNYWLPCTYDASQIPWTKTLFVCHYEYWLIIHDHQIFIF